MRAGCDLGYLKTIESASGIIPVYLHGDLALVDLVAELVHYVRDALGVVVMTGVTKASFPNSRGNIDYDFGDGRCAVEIGGEIRHETALRILFFVAHGIGHASQHEQGRSKLIHEQFVTPASSAVGSRKMEEIVCFENTYVPFKALFTSHEREATRVGWRIIERYLAAVGRTERRLAVELGFWYSLYGIVDHLYHRQSIAGPFPSEPSEWLSIFGRKLESVLMPYMMTSWEEQGSNRFSEVPPSVYVGADGWFYWAEGEVKAALAALREQFTCGLLDPFSLRLADNREVRREIVLETPTPTAR